MSLVCQEPVHKPVMNKIHEDECFLTFRAKPICNILTHFTE